MKLKCAVLFANLHLDFKQAYLMKRSSILLEKQILLIGKG